MPRLNEDPQYAFPDHPQIKQDQKEIMWQKHELRQVKAERDSANKAAPDIPIQMNRDVTLSRCIAGFGRYHGRPRMSIARQVGFTAG